MTWDFLELFEEDFEFSAVVEKIIFEDLTQF
jgi:hypothetical protein